MKKNVWSKLLLTSLVVAGVGIYGNEKVSAEDSTLPSTATTDAKATFTDDSGKTDPVNPINPSEPGNNDNDNGNKPTGNTGTLTLDVAPTTFDFGSNGASNNAMTINAQKAGKTDGLQFLQVSDKRTDANGWKVTVKQTKEFTTSDNSKNINGTTITIPKGDDRNSLADNPSTAGNTGLTTNGVTTKVGSEQEVFLAPNSQNVGKSVSTDSWKSSDVTLNVPKFTAKTGDYSSQLEWSLTTGV